MKKIIYDFGANKGDNIPYYLMKADKVIAVEANPDLCIEMNKKYYSEIEEGKVVIENCVITSNKRNKKIDFYLHKTNNVLSQFPKPNKNQIENFEKTTLPCKTVKNIISKYGNPHYIKIDIEHYDSEILRALWNANIIPPYISAESHSIEVFSLLVSMGYTGFKIIDGVSVAEKYSNRVFEGIKESFEYSFPFHSAGPFGNDIDGVWMTPDNFFHLLSAVDLGWKDIHASIIDEVNPYAKLVSKM